jgi:hypothetical protein
VEIQTFNHIVSAGSGDTPQPAVVSLDVWRDRAAWYAAAEHLNSRGMAACVPCELGGWLRRRGLATWCQERAA